MTPILTSSPLTTTLMSVNLAIIIGIIVLLCGVAGFTIWAAQRKLPLERGYEAVASDPEYRALAQVRQDRRDRIRHMEIYADRDLGVQLRKEAQERIERVQRQIADLQRLRDEL